jgi:hypothetical protein
MSRRNDTFKFRVCYDERQMLAAIAERLQRSQADTIRLLIREAARELVRDDANRQFELIESHDDA